MTRQIIFRNSAKCLKCGHEIESKHRHDYVSCKCGAIAVDGGHDYLRRSYVEDGAFQDTSSVQEVEDK